MSTENTQLVKVIQLSEDIEEEVTVSIDGNEITCFVAGAAIKLEIGLLYPAILRLTVFDDYLIEEMSDESNESISKLNRGYSYKIVGRLNNGLLSACGFQFHSDELSSEYSFLDSKMISIHVDRIDIRFVRKSTTPTT